MKNFLRIIRKIYKRLFKRIFRKLFDNFSSSKFLDKLLDKFLDRFSDKFSPEKFTKPDDLLEPIVELPFPPENPVSSVSKQPPEMRMLPSNGFAYNFNGPALNGYGQLSINHPTGTSLDLHENAGQAEHATHLIDSNGLQHSQLYELHPHQAPPSAPTNGYGQPSNGLESANLESANLVSLFKLKSFLNHPNKKNEGASMQSMFPGGQESTSQQLLASPTENGIHLINHESNLSHHSPIVQTTSASYYNNLAPTAIGTSAIVSAPMLLSQSSDHQATIDSIRNQSIGGNQLIGFEPHHLTRSNASQSTGHHQHPHHQLSSAAHHTRAASARLVREAPSRNFVCKFCKVSFQSKGEMQVHYSAHTREEKPFKCEVCTKRFKRANYLKQHKRVHTNETPFCCRFEKCDKKFKQLGHLKQHNRTHTGEKPYKCKYSDCDKCFSQESNLRSHMRSHESGRPFKCNSCHLTFEQEQDLLAHIPRHRETKHTKIHICEFCGKSYNAELYLTKHVQAKHAERIQSLRAGGTALPAAPTSLPPAVRTRAKLSSKESNRLTSPSNSPSSNSSSKSNVASKSKKTSSPAALAGGLQAPPVPQQQQQQQQTSTPSHINTQYSNSWNRSTAGSSSPDSVNSSNCMSSTASTEMISLTNCFGNSSIAQSGDQMFTDLNGSSTMPTRYEQMDLFYGHHPNNMTPNGQHQSAFTPLGRSASHSPKYFTNSGCDSGFVFSKPQYSPISGNPTAANSQLHSSSVNQQHSPDNQSIHSHNASQLSHNSGLPDNQLLQQQQQSSPANPPQSLQSMHQLSPLNGHMPIQSSIQSSIGNNLGSLNSSIQSSVPSSIGSAQTSPVQLHHLQHGQSAGQQANQHHSQLIALNQIRNYACMPNGSPSTILPPQPTANHHHHHSSPFVNNIFLNAQNNNSSIQSMSSCNLNDYPIMILQ